jgi:hypothetical protein
MATCCFYCSCLLQFCSSYLKVFIGLESFSNPAEQTTRVLGKKGIELIVRNRNVQVSDDNQQNEDQGSRREVDDKFEVP